MIRKLILLDLVLLVLLTAVSWQIRQRWVETRGREQRMLRARTAPGVTQPPSPLARVSPLKPGSYSEVADKNLFSRDRNATVIPDPPPPPPPPPPEPPLPVARGVMLWDGAPPTVVMSLKGNLAQRGYHAGDKVGEWKISSFDNQFITLEWNGKQYKKRLDELMDRTPIAMVADASAPSPGPMATQSAAPKSLSGLAGSDRVGIDTGAGNRGCVAGDSSPPGTVEGGYKKMVTETPFGKNCRWEAVK